MATGRTRERSKHALIQRYDSRMAIVMSSQGKNITAKIPGRETGIAIKKTHCSICDYQCGIDAYVKDGRLIKVEGTEVNPVNNGRLCSKGAASKQWIYSPERLQTPLLRAGERGSGAFTSISWEEALDRIASRLLRSRRNQVRSRSSFSRGIPRSCVPFSRGWLIPSVLRITAPNPASALWQPIWQAP